MGYDGLILISVVVTIAVGIVLFKLGVDVYQKGYMQGRKDTLDTIHYTLENSGDKVLIKGVEKTDNKEPIYTISEEYYAAQGFSDFPDEPLVLEWDETIEHRLRKEGLEV